MFKRKQDQRSKLQKSYDEKLLSAIYEAMSDWNRAKETVISIDDADEELISQTQLARAKYLFLYHEARIRGTKGDRLMPGAARSEHDFLE
ncbi:YaaL family protein [Loigolactobacillus coryniformis]|jgi:hypothetical protein|uniref:DUF2508 family protein n=3 Tax=Loigolactobacillus coryniformis TaxID=1610 RepID=A0A0R1F0W3_9LACO|nr:YaaL family protein [Loigolactobacillus coryniformis]OEH89216.1 hypothetical protein ATO00_12815 [Loigolactobacillus coryniformis subsp. coryniformis]ATO43433.1 hypothetical protein LC20004_05720 [Loigolactobacillus coryniformis subsp. torquens DSM 20004 = KCTC 3535]ATO55107.1 hypothetical protein LC20001_05445 [Loigolactobacillus coryniformis subsp. coryniformis KCTC 3167 = DSM 20001]KRK15596.1 hypothetical protein FD22_GL001636 [Loigolactobacillus coryniformis subsp. coryniformis KCTC 3167